MGGGALSAARVDVTALAGVALMLAAAWFAVWSGQKPPEDPPGP